MSRRYLGLDDFRGLLDEMSRLTDKPLAYFVARGEGRNPRIASAIAEALFEPWWSDPRFAESRDLFAGSLAGQESPLKVEVARRMRAFLELLPTDGALKEELDLLRKATVDGVITTNYDELLETIFPEFRVYVGQDELLFADVQGVGEIYKVHGCASSPDSLVLTQRDYDQFGRRNPYLAAKLLATFVERPVIFLGYSLGDQDVTDILTSISSVLTSDTIDKLRDRLVFVQWDPQAINPVLTTNHMPLGDDRVVPILSLRLADFRELFSMLGTIPRKFSARLLRQLKEQVYELVLANEPSGRLAVVDIDAIEGDTHNVDVVFGVGIQEHLGLQGYVGLTRDEVLHDVLRKRSQFRADGVLQAIPGMQGAVPLYRYLRGADLVDNGGCLNSDAQVSDQVRSRLVGGLDRFTPAASLRPTGNRKLQSTDGSIGDLLMQHGEKSVLYYYGLTSRDDIDLEALRTFLIKHAPSSDSYKSHWAKLVCLYDYYRYGPGGDGDGGTANDE